MGHNIEYRDYPENVDKNEVYASINTYVHHATWEEGGSGIPRIRWLSKEPLSSRDDAKSYIQEQDNLNYDCLAVRYRWAVKHTKAYDEASAKYQAAFQRWRKLYNAKYADTVSSEYVGCKNCGSKLARKYLRSNNCPLCLADLRSKTTLDTIARAKATLDTREKELAEAERKMNQKGQVRWLVKFEYHT